MSSLSFIKSKYANDRNVGISHWSNMPDIRATSEFPPQRTVSDMDMIFFKSPLFLKRGFKTDTEV